MEAQASSVRPYRKGALTSRRLRRDPDLVLVWRADELLIRNVRTRRSVRVSPEAVALLSVFDSPRTISAVAHLYPHASHAEIAKAIVELERFGLLVANGEGSAGGRLAAWNGNVASALYHAATRDLQYLVDPSESAAYLRARHAETGSGPRFKRYPGLPSVSLRLEDGAGKPADLATVLAARRTTRDFSRRPVPLASVAAVCRGTWGQTGWLESRDICRFPTRSSPSGGALHPIECYLLAFRVEGLDRGLYHYDVGKDELRRLKFGDFRSEAVRLASGQVWVGKSAFLCIMTAVFGRTTWKYRRENAYRTVWLEAGHFAQTFSLLATAHGLGPFTTAAMQDSRIERFIGLDGIREFPVYLCGAGVPGPLKVSPPWTPLVRRRPPAISAGGPSMPSPSKPRRAAP